MVVSNTHMLATIRGAGNAVAVQSENMGLTSYAGPGAGRFPTANSVVADILRVAAGQSHPLCPKQTDSLVLDNDYEASFYVRIPTSSANIVRQLAELADVNGIAIKSLSAADQSVVVMTNPCKLSKVESLTRSLLVAQACESDPVFMPVLM
jgi:homoserine dehydrogenase